MKEHTDTERFDFLEEVFKDGFKLPERVVTFGVTTPRVTYPQYGHMIKGADSFRHAIDILMSRQEVESG